VLQLREVDTFYGAIQALYGVSLDVQEGEIVAIIGPNGSGKSTAVRTIAGLRPARSGSIRFRGTPIETLRPDLIVRQGLALVPQGRQLFGGLSVRENLEMGSYIRNDPAAIHSDIERMFAIFPVLKDRLDQQAATLSGGEQQMVAIARALLSRPKLLMLDEPSNGLAPSIIDRVFDRIQEINKQGVTIVVVEQNVAVALAISHRTYVLESGCVVLEGASAELADDNKIQQLFLGGGAAAGTGG
jgi:branched-chain amino acid transport system ATP-binding protein